MEYNITHKESLIMKNKGPLIVHLIFWLFIVTLCLLAIINSKEQPSSYEILVQFGYYGIINVSLFYINYTLLIPELIKSRKMYWWYILSITALILVMGLIKTVIASLNSEIMLSFTNQRTNKKEFIDITTYAIRTIFISGFFIVISSLLKFAVDWFANERIQRSLESEKKDMELQFLKSQLNPHFLFNSLNNIYSLAYQKSDKTADAVLKLSEIMRYMI